jgi:glyoxylase-like metal-dependent hydrolase (beta-lactamase superfamily II)
MQIKTFFDKNTSTYSYVVNDITTKECAVIDPVLDYDMYSGKVTYNSADTIISYIKENDLKLKWILETHAHADHLTSSHYIKEKIGGSIAIGENIKKIIQYWTKIFNTYEDTPQDGSQFDRLFKDGENFKIGNIDVKVINTPGHTPACVSYIMEDCVFVGDTIFMPYVGTARTDFPGGSAEILYESIQKIFSLPDHTKIYTCHDYPPEGKEAGCLSTVSEQKNSNVMINNSISKENFIKLRNAKDEGKAVPKLLLPSIQINIRAGNLGKAEINKTNYIKIPLNKIGTK